MERKIMPALYDLYQHHENTPFAILGVSRTQMDDAAFRARMEETLAAHGVPAPDAASWSTSHLFYQPLQDTQPEGYAGLEARITEIETKLSLGGNRVYYLALPPSVFEPTITALGLSGMAHRDGGWTRIIVEKPFGQDLATATHLNEAVHRYFDENQVYRIDHYLGKETVRNLMVFRLGNAVFESLWNREHIERVDMIVAEDLGVGTRAGYYDRAGALRDMLQNHLTQLLTLVAMEVPATDSADAIRHEKIKVLQSTRPIDRANVVLGQYTRGKMNDEDVAGYREEKGVPSDSETPTYVALRAWVDNWRWQGVPFVLQTGKRLPRRLTRIAVTFRRPPVTFFRQHDECRLAPNVLHITLQPDEGFSLSFEVKAPGDGFDVRTQNLRFQYEEAFGKLPEAYRTLLEDIVRGDQTLFVHAEEVEASWRLYTPLLDDPQPIHFYAAGTTGPMEAQRLTGEMALPLFR